MQVKAKKDFRDKVAHRSRFKGDEFPVTKERGEELKDLDLVEETATKTDSDADNRQTKEEKSVRKAK